MTSHTSAEHDKAYENLPIELISDLLMILDQHSLCDGCFCSACNYSFEHRGNCTATTKSRTHCWSCDGHSIHEADCITESARRYLKHAGINHPFSSSVN